MIPHCLRVFLYTAVTAAFGELDHRVVLVPDNGPERFEGLYGDVLRARFGNDFRPGHTGATE